MSGPGSESSSLVKKRECEDVVVMPTHVTEVLVGVGGSEDGGETDR
jgi:hypothetical protein